MENVVPVVVLRDEGGYVALAVARSLGRLGVPMYLVGPKKPSAVTPSRYWTKTFAFDSFEPKPLLQLLIEVRREIGVRPILLGVSDWAALFMEQNSSALEEYFIFPKPAPGLIQMLTNKWQMFLAAKQHGVPTPQVTYPQSRDDVVTFLQTASFPIVVKGVDQLLPNCKWKVIVYSANELFEKYDRAAQADSPNIMLQEYIPGDDKTVWMCNAYFDSDSQCRAAMTGTKLRQFPPYAGFATLAVCDPNAVVEEATRHFMHAVGYQGLVGIGYRYDARDGQYKVLDVNPRVSGVFRLFVSPDGLDVVRTCYLDLSGQPIPTMEPSPGRKWLLELDFVSAVRYARDGKLSFREWLSSLRGVKELHWFAPDDVLPFFVFLRIRLWKIVRGYSYAVRRRIAALAKDDTTVARPATPELVSTSERVEM